MDGQKCVPAQGVFAKHFCCIIVKKNADDLCRIQSVMVTLMESEVPLASHTHTHTHTHHTHTHTLLQETLKRGMQPPTLIGSDESLAKLQRHISSPIQHDIDHSSECIG